MAEVFACLVYVLDGSTVSIDVNVSIKAYVYFILTQLVGQPLDL